MRSGIKRSSWRRPARWLDLRLSRSWALCWSRRRALGGRADLLCDLLQRLGLAAVEAVAVYQDEPKPFVLDREKGRFDLRAWVEA